MAHLSGKIGKVTVGVTDVAVTGWTFDTEEESLNTTDTADAGYASSIGGIKSGSGTFTANWDDAAQATDNPPNIVPGAEPAKIRLYLGDPGDGKFFDLTSVRITAMNIASPVEGQPISYTCNFVTTGAWVNPV
jgi:hypothetical protein